MGVEVGAAIAVGSFATNQIERGKADRAARKRAAEEADLTEEQTRLETERREELTEDVIDQQRLAFFSSGTLLEGSPIMVLEETRDKSLEELENFKTVRARQADLTRNRVRSAFLGGIFQDLGSAVQLGSSLGGLGGSKPLTTQRTFSAANSAVNTSGGLRFTNIA